MGWGSERAGHEGWDAPLLADGWIGSGYERRGVLVSTDAQGTFHWGEPTVRPDTDVVGWVAACECGWRGQPVLRVSDPALAATAEVAEARTAYSPDAHAPEELAEGLLRREWRQHVEPFDLVATVTEAHRAHQRTGEALDVAVAAARSAGASWADVGRATGMTRQSANERWSRRLTQ